MDARSEYQIKHEKRSRVQLSGPMLTRVSGVVLLLLVGRCSALAPQFSIARPVVSVHRSHAVHMDEAQQKEIDALKAKLKAAEATIVQLLAAQPGGQVTKLTKEQPVEHEEDFSNSRFPLFRMVQSNLAKSLSGLQANFESPIDLADLQVSDVPSDDSERNFKKEGSDSSARADASQPKQQRRGLIFSPNTDVDGNSVEELFGKYDFDRSGQLDINEFRSFVMDMDLPAMAQGTAKSAETFASDLAKGTAKSAEDLAGGIGDFASDLAKGTGSDLAKGTAKAAEKLVADTTRSADEFAKSVLGIANDLAKGVNDLAASAGVPGASARVPVTLVGGVGSGYKELLSASSSDRDVPVEALIVAIERQATLSMHLGGFMQLIVKLDRGNMKAVRESWLKHGQPSSLRELLKAEVAEGVLQPTRLKEGSAALSLLWSMRAKRFWTTVADGFADQRSSEQSSTFGLRAYELELEPYHGWVLKNIFRPGLLALPSRKEMLTQMALRPSEMMELDACWEAWKEAAAAGEFLTPDERMAACLVELRECSEATKRVTNMVQAQLDEFGLRDDRKL